MKLLKSILPIALFCPIMLAAQSPGSVGNATVALTITYGKAGLMKKNEDGKTIPIASGGMPAHENSWAVNKFNGDDDLVSEDKIKEKSTKLATEKYSNKEILQELLFLERLPEVNENPASISGWSIVQVNGPGAEGVVEAGQFFARHTSKKSVNISDFLSIMLERRRGEAKVVTGRSNAKTTYPSKPGAEPVLSGAESYSMTYQAEASFDGYDIFYSGIGVLKGGYKFTAVPYKEDGKTYYEPMYVPGATKLTGIIGSTPVVTFFNGEFSDETTGLLGGVISIAAAKGYADLRAYMIGGY